MAWNPLGFYFLDALPKANTFNAEYYRANILTELLLLRPQVDERRLVIHADSVRPSTAGKYRAFYKENRLRFTVHPPYLPDLASSDFFFFEHIKHFLPGIAFPSYEELLAAIHEIVGAIPQPTLDGIFQHWMERLE
jgi:hypothetical protein